MRLPFLTCLLLSCATAPVVAPKTGPENDLKVQFAPDQEPQPGQLFVCALQPDGKLWCVDYQMFLEQLNKRTGAPTAETRL